ncbi:MAG: DUF2269 domain-containing protein [Neisseria sp.]|nr:DUF2269 domain-containing protein [Neisseria sp.]
MNVYLFVKTLHILSATLLVGTGFGTAFYLFWANRSGSLQAQAVVSHWVVKADWWFTTPAVVFQFCSGLWMMSELHWPWGAAWIWGTLALFVFVGICWLPVVWLQVRMAKLAAAARDEGGEMPSLYWRYARIWEFLGYPAFCATVVIYFLMVMKPV